MFITTDPNSKEILRDPQSAAEVRITTLTRAKSRLEAVFAHKLNLERPEPAIVSEQPVPVFTTAPYTPSVAQEISQPQPTEITTELNIDTIRFSIEQAFRDHIETIEDVSI